ncbi:MAG: NAD kinase [Bacteroidota bacterium]|nr:NAD kinase [Bacteroidota bacterium]
MKIALFGKVINPDDLPILQSMIGKLESAGVEILLFEPFYISSAKSLIFRFVPSFFSRKEELVGKADYLFSIGGDGTLLDTITLVGNSGLPVMGINMGRLGFLSSISKDHVESAIDALLSGNIFLDRRTLLRLETEENLFGEFNYALNDITIFKSPSVSMLNIKAYINGEFLNTYWADGLIVATPTGSTAYSLSCTGPILTLDAEAFVITPIASHNLTVRPIVIPDDSEIRIEVIGRELEGYVGLDSRSERLDHFVKLIIRKEDFKFNIVRMKHTVFFKTIREKLNWGLDIRN